MNPAASEISQGAATAVLGVAAVGIGIWRNWWWLIAGGAIAAAFGIDRWQRNAALANPTRPAVSAFAAFAGLPDPNTLTVGTRSPDGRYVVALNNKQLGGNVWAVDAVAPVRTDVLAAGAQGIG